MVMTYAVSATLNQNVYKSATGNCLWMAVAGREWIMCERISFVGCSWQSMLWLLFSGYSKRKQIKAYLEMIITCVLNTALFKSKIATDVTRCVAVLILAFYGDRFRKVLINRVQNRVTILKYPREFMPVVQQGQQLLYINTPMTKHATRITIYWVQSFIHEHSNDRNNI